MAMKANSDTIWRLLRQAAESHQSKLEERVEKSLCDREKRILQWLFQQYEDKSKKRWYDPYHVLFSSDFALSLVEEVQLDRSMLTAIMLHDIGYFAIPDKTQWDSPDSRIIQINHSNHT